MARGTPAVGKIWQAYPDGRQRGSRYYIVGMRPHHFLSDQTVFDLCTLPPKRMMIIFDHAVNADDPELEVAFEDATDEDIAIFTKFALLEGLD